MPSLTRRSSSSAQSSFHSQVRLVNPQLCPPAKIPHHNSLPVNLPLHTTLDPLMIQTLILLGHKLHPNPRGSNPQFLVKNHGLRPGGVDPHPHHFSLSCKLLPSFYKKWLTGFLWHCASSACGLEVIEGWRHEVGGWDEEGKGGGEILYMYTNHLNCLGAATSCCIYKFLRLLVAYSKWPQCAGLFLHVWIETKVPFDFTI